LREGRLTPPEYQGRVCGEDWQPIETAPRDGSTILLTAFEDDGSQYEIHPMMWAHIQRNGLFPGVVGMWTAPSGAYTWNEAPEQGGPTHWRQMLRDPTGEELDRARDRLAAPGIIPFCAVPDGVDTGGGQSRIAPASFTARAYPIGAEATTGGVNPLSAPGGDASQHEGASR
jgi:hypothetical protein